MPDHPSSSTVQLQAERVILDALGAQLGCRFEQKTPAINGCQIDGVCEKPPILVEVFAHQGSLRGGQVHKVVSDAARLHTASLTLARPPRKIVCFADAEAARSFADGRGWRRKFLDSLGIEVAVVDIPDALAFDIRSAQAAQFR